MREVRIASIANETIELDIPKKFTLNDTRQFILDNENILFRLFEEMIDDEVDFAPEQITSDSCVPFLGEELPISHCLRAWLVTAFLMAACICGRVYQTKKSAKQC